MLYNCKIAFNLGVLVALVFFINEVFAQTPDSSYLSGMPSIEKIKTQIKGENPTITRLKQRIALQKLQRMIKFIIRYRASGTPTKQENDLISMYSMAEQVIIQEDLNSSRLNPKEHENWLSMYEQYSKDEELWSDIITKLVNKKVREEYHQALSKEKEEDRQAEKIGKLIRHILDLRPIGLGIFILWMGYILFNSGRKTLNKLDKFRFENTNTYGITEVQNYKTEQIIKSKIYWSGQMFKFGITIMLIGGIITIIAIASY